jgi:hypothetical protein
MISSSLHSLLLKRTNALAYCHPAIDYEKCWRRHYETFFFAANVVGEISWSVCHLNILQSSLIFGNGQSLLTE